MSFPRDGVVGHTFKASDDNELSVRKGDLVVVQEANDSGWVFVTKDTGDAGWVPEAYLKNKDKKKKKKKKKDKQAPAKPAPVPEQKASDSDSDDDDDDDDGPPRKAAPSAPSAASRRSMPTPPGPPTNDDAPPAKKAPSIPKPKQAKAAAAASATQRPLRGPVVFPDHKFGEPCGSCGKRVGGEDSLVAKGITFHSECFRCQVCNQNLRGKGFLHKEGKFYCEEDYYETHNPKCGHCDMAIMAEYVKALDKLWHPEHFVCTTCECDFPDDVFRKFEGMPYCEPCYKKALNATCSKCNLAIDGKVYTAMGLRFHLECFVCQCGNCDEEAIGVDAPYRVYDDKVMIVEHFLDLFRDDCAGCGKKIRLKAEINPCNGKKYHQGCWKCTCGAALTADTFIVGEDGQATCRKCEQVRQQAAQEALALLQAAREAAQRQLGAALALMAELEKKARQIAREREQAYEEEQARLAAEIEGQEAKKRQLEEDARRRAFEEEQKRIADEEEAEARRMLWEAQQMFDEENENRVRCEIKGKKAMIRLQNKLAALAWERAQAQFDELDNMKVDLEEKGVVAVTLQTAQEEAARQTQQEKLRLEALVSNAYDTSFSLDDLINGNLPPHIDRREKEMHLTDAMFEKLFAMNKDSFAKLPTWKRNKMKKKVGLY